MSDPHIIVSAWSETCLERLASSLGYKGLSVDGGHTSRLMMDIDLWNDLSPEGQEHVLNFSSGFVVGWEAAKDTMDEEFRSE